MLILPASASVGADYGPRKRVLIIESFGQPPASASAVAFRTTLERELGQPVDIYYASMDVARFPGPNQEATLSDFLKSRYQERKLDLVAAMQWPAAQFVAGQRDQLFPDTPIIITGIERRRVPAVLNKSTTTSVAAEFDFPGAVEHMLQLLPDTRRITIINGSSSYDRAWTVQNRQEFKRFAQRVEIEWLENLTIEDMRAQVANLPAGSVVLLGLVVLDAAGIQLGREEFLERLREVSKVPIFGYFESFVGKGIVGGRLYANVTMGTESARVAIRILKGEAPDTIAPLVVKQTRPIYDWRELQRFGISEDRLPPGSEVRYRQQTVWEAYRWHIAATIALLLLQASLIGGLLLQRARQQRWDAERKRAGAELLHTRGELAHMSRVSALGDLAASIAHELNQPLTAILSNAQAAQRFLSAGRHSDIAEVREILQDIIQDSNRADEVIRRLRALARKETLEFAPLELEAAMREVALLLHSDAVLHNVRVVLEFNHRLPQVHGDKVQLQQVALNLLLNAFDAMKDFPANEREVVVRGELDEARAVTVAVRDRGTGLSGDTFDRIFQSFYTTKRDGLGMGLSISRSIIQAHGGWLWAENNADRGATFYFTLPVDGGQPLLPARAH